MGSFISSVGVKVGCARWLDNACVSDFWMTYEYNRIRNKTELIDYLAQGVYTEALCKNIDIYHDSGYPYWSHYILNEVYHRRLNIWEPESSKIGYCDAKIKIALWLAYSDEEIIKIVYDKVNKMLGKYNALQLPHMDNLPKQIIEARNNRETHIKRAEIMVGSHSWSSAGDC